MGLADPVRDGVRQSVAECRSAGIRVVMITGDYPGTARAIARQVGLDEGTGIITGTELEVMSDEELSRPHPHDHHLRPHGARAEAPPGAGIEGQR